MLRFSGALVPGPKAGEIRGGLCSGLERTKRADKKRATNNRAKVETFHLAEGTVHGLIKCCQ